MFSSLHSWEIHAEQGRYHAWRLSIRHVGEPSHPACQSSEVPSVRCDSDGGSPTVEAFLHAHCHHSQAIVRRGREMLNCSQSPALARHLGGAARAAH
jgi:hypothetical protein